MLHLHPGGITLTKKLIEHCDFSPNAAVVDIGCGSGITVGYLHDYCGVNPIGVDLAKARLEEGRKRHTELVFLQEDSEKLSFADGSIDGIIMECSLSVMRDKPKTLSEVSRIMAPGGKLGITDLYIRQVLAENSYCYLPETHTGKDICKVKYNLLAMLKKNNFQIKIFEDQSVCLKEFVAAYIMEYGVVPEFRKGLSCQASMGDFYENEKRKLGYFLLVAEKNGEKDKRYGKTKVSSL
ncbi:MAG: DVU_1556 family methyltransferase [Selenomonadaceae bacterium]